MSTVKPSQIGVGDYVNYFFTGYKLEGMNPALMAFLRAFHYVIIAAVSIVIFNIYTALTNGTFEFSWKAWQQYLLPAVIFIVGFLNETLRKNLNPSISVKTIPPDAQRLIVESEERSAPDAVTAQQAPVTTKQVIQDIQQDEEHKPGPHEVEPHLRSDFVPPQQIPPKE